MIFQTHNVFAYVFSSSLECALLPPQVHACEYLSFSSLSYAPHAILLGNPVILWLLLSEVIPVQGYLPATTQPFTASVHRGNVAFSSVLLLYPRQTSIVAYYILLFVYIFEISTRLWSLSQVIDLRKILFYEVFDPLTPPYNDFSFLGNRCHQ